MEQSSEIENQSVLNRLSDMLEVKTLFYYIIKGFTKAYSKM
jgi:hypothetical protein